MANLRLCLRRLISTSQSSSIRMSSSSSNDTLGGPVQKNIAEKLNKEFRPVHLQILNESYMHNVPKGSETHFKVLVVSQQFQDKKLIDRHRLVNDCLSEELSSGVHALSVVAKTPAQFEAMENKKLEQSPACKGGFGK